VTRGIKVVGIVATRFHDQFIAMMENLNLPAGRPTGRGGRGRGGIHWLTAPSGQIACGAEVSHRKQWSLDPALATCERCREVSRDLARTTLEAASILPANGGGA